MTCLLSVNLLLLDEKIRFELPSQSDPSYVSLVDCVHVCYSTSIFEYKLLQRVLLLRPWIV